MPLFSSEPNRQPCFFCATPTDRAGLQAHYRSHLVEVTDDAGRRAYTFDCPRCGRMDLAWGGGRPDPAGNAAAAVAVHLMERHGISFV